MEAYGTYVLKMNGCGIFPKSNVPVGGCKNEDGRCCTGEDEGEYRVRFEGKDEECEHCETQGNKIQGYASIIAHG